MNKQKLGSSFMLLGFLCILAAAALLIHNRLEAKRAEEASRDILPQLQDMIADTTPRVLGYYFADADEELPEMTVKEIDGYGYIGYLNLPVLKLELPIMSYWDYERLTVAPCRQFGSVKGDDLVIAGHNYPRHFGSLRVMKPGDVVTFTDMDGEVITYTVDVVDTVDSTAVDEVRDSAWDLVLYTCTYGGKSRVIVGCNRIEE